MTKKDYVAIARAVKDIAAAVSGSEDFRAGFNYGVDAVVFALLDVFERDNGRFDRARFLAACGVMQQNLGEKP